MKVQTNQSFIVVLKSVGNPDYGQYAPLSPKKVVAGDTYQDLVNAAKEYIRKWNLGGGNCPPFPILHPTKGLVATISYNGRVWDLENNQITNLKINAND